MPDETGRGRIRLSFLNEENLGNSSGYGRLFLISFSISIQSGDQLMKIMRPLYNVPKYWSSREDYVMGYWFCFPGGTSATSGELQHCGYSNSIDCTELYPQLYIESEQRDEGEEYRGSVWFMAGPINFPGWWDEKDQSICHDAGIRKQCRLVRGGTTMKKMFRFLCVVVVCLLIAVACQ